MILYRDIFTNEEVFTSAYRVELIDDLYYKVHGKYCVEDLGVADHLIGANRSAEDECCEEEDNKVLKPNIISSNNLEETTIDNKKDYGDAISKYVKKLVKKVEETDKERAEFLRQNLKEKFVLPFIQKIKKKEVRIFASGNDQYDLEGSLIHFEQEVADGSECAGTCCCFCVLKDGLVEEKC